MSERRGSFRWLFWPSLSLSIALHVGGIVFLLRNLPEKPGAVSQPATAISINLETTDILDSPEQSAATATAAANAPAAPVAPPEELKPEEDKPEERPPEAAKPTPAPEKPPESEPPPQPIEQTAQPPEQQPQADADVATERERERIAEEALRKAEAEEAEKREAERREAERAAIKRTAAERKETQRKETERREREAEARAERQRTQAREAAQEQERERRKQSRQQPKAGASGARGAQASKGRVSASQGSIRDYAAMVRARIARNKPASRGGNGRVVVAFALSASGSLIAARVVSSSGNASLDQSALAAVQRSSPFPAPPAASSAQLRFTMPFQFR